VIQGKFFIQNRFLDVEFLETNFTNNKDKKHYLTPMLANTVFEKHFLNYPYHYIIQIGTTIMAKGHYRNTFKYVETTPSDTILNIIVSVNC